MEGVQVCCSVCLVRALGWGELMGRGREFFVLTSIRHSVLVPARTEIPYFTVSRPQQMFRGHVKCGLLSGISVTLSKGNKQIT